MKKGKGPLESASYGTGIAISEAVEILFSALLLISPAMASNDLMAPWLVETKTRYEGSGDIAGSGVVFKIDGKPHLLVVSHITQGLKAEAQLQGRSLQLSKERLAANAWDLEIIKIDGDIETPWIWRNDQIVADGLDTQFRSLQVGENQFIPLATQLNGQPIGWEAARGSRLSFVKDLGVGMDPARVAPSLNLVESFGAIKIVPGMSGSPLIEQIENQFVVRGLTKAYHRFLPLSYFASEHAIKKLVQAFSGGGRGQLQNSRWKFNGITYRESFGFSETSKNVIPSGNGATAEGGNGATAEGGTGAIADTDNFLLNSGRGAPTFVTKSSTKSKPVTVAYPYLFSYKNQDAYAIRVEAQPFPKFYVYSPQLLETLIADGASVSTLTSKDDLAKLAFLRSRAKTWDHFGTIMDDIQKVSGVFKDRSSCRIEFASPQKLKIALYIYSGSSMEPVRLKLESDLNLRPSDIIQKVSVKKDEVTVDLTSLYLQDLGRTTKHRLLIDQERNLFVDVWIPSKNIYQSISCHTGEAKEIL